MSSAATFSLNSLMIGTGLVEPQKTGNGGFLFAPTMTQDVFTREQFNEEQLEIGKMVRNFVETKIKPCLEKIEKKALDADGTPVAVKLLKEAGQLGLLGIDIPQEYGGMEMDFISTMYMFENLCSIGSLSVSIMAHMGIATLPILFFGTPEQKAKYLPKLASGEWVSCYALTEPGAGSDALSGKTKAVLEGDHFILNGAKQYITNGAWANLSIVFTSIENQYSALLVELNQPGVVRGAEEKKMGIKGSSTTSLAFENVKVPKENLLGKIGDASTIALNTLNMGRLDLGVATVGAAKEVLKSTIAYGKERKQFSRPIIEFDMQLARLADMASRIFAVDSMVYRITYALDQKINAIPKDEEYHANVVKAIRSFAMEASVAKVEGSEMLHQVACDAIKMHGGYGYIEEYHVECALRDCFINMIFEGTNDINRLVIFDFLTRNIYGQGVPFHSFIEEINETLSKRHFEYPGDKEILADEKARVYAAKYLLVYLIHETILRYGKDIKNDQQLITAIADMIIQMYLVDSTLSRAHYLTTTKNQYSDLAQSIASLTTSHTLEKVRSLAWHAVNEICRSREKTSLRENVSWLCHLTASRDNVYELRRMIARAILEDSKLVTTR